MRPFSPPKPKRSQSIPAVSSRPSPSRARPLDLLDRLEHAQVAGDLGRVLGEEGELDRGAALDGAGGRLELAREQLHQRRLAGAVDADERDAVARAEPPGRVAQERLRRRRRSRRARRRAPSCRGATLAKRSSSALSRASGSSAISALAASIRNFGFDVRAGGPRRSQASSLRISCWRRSSRAAACARARRGRARRPRSRPRTGARRRRRPPTCGCRPRRGTSDRG